MTCTAEDESRVINYVLNRLPAALRDYSGVSAASRRPGAAFRRVGRRA